MGVIAVGDIAQVTTVAVLHSQTILNTFHYRASAVTGSPDVALEMPKLGTAFDNNVLVEIAARQSDQLVYTHIDCQMIDPVRFLRVPFTPTNDQGGSTIASLPTSVAVVVKKLTAKAGRRYRGRCYFAGIPTGDALSSGLTTTALQSWQENVAPEITAQLTTEFATWTPVIYNKGQTPNYTEIIASSVDQTLRNQRRRQLWVGI